MADQSLIYKCLSRTKEYFDNSSIHGIRYITESGRNIVERIFWTAICGLAIYATYRLTVATWYNFQYNAVSFVVETSYLDWNTTFPAVSVCENEAPDKIFEYAESLFGEDRNINLDLFLSDITFFDGTCSSCSTCGISMNCTENIQDLVDKVRAPCDEFIDSCKWNGKPFDCCSQFLPIVTEMGICYSLGSLHTQRNNKSSELNMVSNRIAGPGGLHFVLYEAARVYIHAPEDVPYINHPQEERDSLNWGTVLTMMFQVIEIDNDPTLREVSVEQRNCRFPKENILKSYKHYSYSGCVIDCRAKAQVEFCNCTHHFMPKLPGVETCTIRGLICLTQYSDIIRSLRTRDSEKKGLVCDCLPSCKEPEYTVISKNQKMNEDYNDEKFGTKVDVIMDTLPSQRFKRNVVRTRLDLVVSIGGTTGLFLGASLLSTVELIYFMFIRKRNVSVKNNNEPQSLQNLLKDHHPKLEKNEITLSNRNFQKHLRKNNNITHFY